MFILLSKMIKETTFCNQINTILYKEQQISHFEKLCCYQVENVYIKYKMYFYLPKFQFICFHLVLTHSMKKYHVYFTCHDLIDVIYVPRWLSVCCNWSRLKPGLKLPAHRITIPQRNMIPHLDTLN